MLTEIAAGWASLKAAREVVQAMNGVENATLVNDVKLTLQRHLLDAQDSLFAAQTAQASIDGRVHELEQQIAELQDWATERAEYELAEVGRGTFAYLPGTGLYSLMPAHWLCANCFGDHRKSILQKVGTAPDPDYDIHRCPSCKTDIVVHGRWYPTYDWNYRFRGWEPTDD